MIQRGRLRWRRRRRRWLSGMRPDSEDERQNARVLAEPDSETSADIDGRLRIGKIRRQLPHIDRGAGRKRRVGVDVNGSADRAPRPSARPGPSSSRPDWRAGAYRGGREREARDDVDHSFDQRDRDTAGSTLSAIPSRQRASGRRHRGASVPAIACASRRRRESDLDASSACR